MVVVVVEEEVEGGDGGEMENTFDIETLAATISSGKKEGIDGEPSISNRLAVCFVAIAPSKKPLLLRDGSLAYEALYSLTRPFYFACGSERTASRAKWDVKCHAGVLTYESIQRRNDTINVSSGCYSRHCFSLSDAYV